MGRTTAWRGLLTGCLLLAAGASSAWAVDVKQMLTTFRPDFPDIQLSTPTPDEYASCELKWVPGKQAGTGSWTLWDAKKQLLRRYSITGGKNFDTFSYFKDGQEVFREIDSNSNGKKDQYRWLNSAGMKWGISTREDGKIDRWKMISAEEAAQEVFMAMAANDFTRMQALFISEPEIQALNLPAAETQRIIGLLKNASLKFQATRTKLPQLDARARFVRVEPAYPNCVPADAATQDLIRFPYRTILFETGEKDKTKHDLVLAGEMIQVGMAFRLVDGPSLQDFGGTEGNVTDNNPALIKLFDELTQLDKTAPPPQPQPKVDQIVQNYNVRRAQIINKIVDQVQGSEKENWIKQGLDNFSAAYQAGHQASLILLTEKRDQIVKDKPGSDLAAFATYKHLCAIYAEKLAKNPVGVQEVWLDQLADFVKAYPKSEETPEPLRLLAQGCEYSGKDEQAKLWNQALYKTFPNHPMAQSAEGAERRLDLIGRNIDIKGPQLGTSVPFNIATHKGKMVVVYYWSSNVEVCKADFNTLKRLQAAHAKDLELVCISLDEDAQAAAQFLQKAQVNAIHLYMPGGFNSPLATYYGINTLPTMFLVGKDGRVIDRTLQANDLEIALRKAL